MSGGGDRTAEPVQILLVDDSPSDVDLTIAAMEEAKMETRVSVVRDGVQAMAFLRREHPYAEAPRPELVLLDLNLPRMDGREVLAEIRSDEHLRRMPVAVLSTSREDSDVLRSYELGANCYITKPVGLDALIEVVHGLEDWLTIVRLPSR